MNRKWMASFGAVVSLVAADGLAAEGLRYQWKPGSTFVYEVEVVADEPEEVATSKGLIEYSVDVEGKLTCRGGLTKSVKRKEKAAPRAGGFPFGGFGPGEPIGFGHPFSRRVSPFKGLETTTNHIELNEQGQVISMKGASHLPYLIGHLSLLPFEPLPDGDEKAWTVDSGIVVSEARDRVEPVFPFGPRSVGESNAEVKKTTGGQVNAYRLVKAEDDLVQFEKTARLETSVGTDREEVRVEGKGVWVFNRARRLPESLEYTHKVIYETDNQMITVPVTITFSRLSDEAWKKVQAEREADARKRKAEHEARVAEQKARAATPLAAEALAAALKDLSSRSANILSARLKVLNGKTDQDPNPELAVALQALILHPDEPIRTEAEKALATYSPEFRDLYAVRSAYRKGAEVEASPFPVSPDLEIPLGLIVQYRERDKWYPGKVIGESEAGEIELRQVRWPHRTRSAKVEDLRLADSRAEQPFARSEALTQLYGKVSSVPPRISLRTWTDDSGSFEIEGTFERIEAEVLYLALENGKQAKVPLDKLSKSDQDYVRRLQETPKNQNPFEVLE